MMMTQASGPDILEDKCLFRVGISITFCLTESPQSRSAKHEQPSGNEMFTVIKCFVVSRISPIFTGKNTIIFFGNRNSQNG